MCAFMHDVCAGVSLCMFECLCVCVCVCLSMHLCVCAFVYVASVAQDLWVLSVRGDTRSISCPRFCPRPDFDSNLCDFVILH